MYSVFKVNKDICIGCGQCVKDCPTRTISMVDGKAEIDNSRCIKCGHCVAICPVAAVSTDDYNMDEVKPFDKESFAVDADNLLNFIKFRRSVRRFKNKEVEKEKIEKIENDEMKYNVLPLNIQGNNRQELKEFKKQLRNLRKKSKDEK